jgi:hypothetical protein
MRIQTKVLCSVEEESWGRLATATSCVRIVWAAVHGVDAGTGSTAPRNQLAMDIVDHLLCNGLAADDGLVCYDDDRYL